METPKAPETARGETTLIGTSIVIKGELSCGEDLWGCSFWDMWHCKKQIQPSEFRWIKPRSWFHLLWLS
jgi:hypothetical protein